MLLSDKYAPLTLGKIVGNRSAVEKLRQFGSEVQSGKKPKPVMVYGPPGTGKTAAVRAIAYSNGFELLELTSSDYRDAETLKKKLLPAVQTRGLFSKVTLILFDEIDELSKDADKGAASIVTQILEETKQPIAFTANDFWDQRISFLRNRVERIEFRKLGNKEIVEYLQKIAKEEGEEVDANTISEIAFRSNGDMRGALNDLQMVMLGGSDILDNLGIRNRRVEIFRTLDRIFMTNSFSTARAAVDESDVDLGMLINWVEENIPARYPEKLTISRAYSELSFASRFFEVAERLRYYSYLRYVPVGVAGVSVSSGGNTKYLAPYSFPTRIKFFSKTKETRGVQARIASKLSPFLHTNRHEIISSYLPLFRSLLGSVDRGKLEEINDSLENSFRLEKEEIAYIAGQA